MNDFNKRLFLSVSWVGDTDKPPYLCSAVITETLKVKILELAKVRAQVDAEIITFIVPDVLWIDCEEFITPENESDTESTLSELSLYQIATNNTQMVVRDDGFYFEAYCAEPEYEEVLFSSDIVPFHALLSSDLHSLSNLYEPLYALRSAANSAYTTWSKNGAVNWQEAEDLVKYINAITPEFLSQMPALTEITRYASTAENWGSGDVAVWPETILKATYDFFNTVPEL